MKNPFKVAFTVSNHQSMRMADLVERISRALGGKKVVVTQSEIMIAIENGNTADFDRIKEMGLDPSFVVANHKI